MPFVFCNETVIPESLICSREYAIIMMPPHSRLLGNWTQGFAARLVREEAVAICERQHCWKSQLPHLRSENASFLSMIQRGRRMRVPHGCEGIIPLYPSKRWITDPADGTNGNWSLVSLSGIFLLIDIQRIMCYELSWIECLAIKDNPSQPLGLPLCLVYRMHF